MEGRQFKHHFYELNPSNASNAAITYTYSICIPFLKIRIRAQNQVLEVDHPDFDTGDKLELCNSYIN